MKQKIEIGFFVVFYAAMFCLVFSTLRSLNTPSFKKGLLESSQLMIRNVR